MKKRIAAPFDGKNLCDDSLRDDVFRDCYYCDDSKGRKTHVLGNVTEDNEDVYFDGIVDARWSETSNTIRIELMACPCQEDFFSMRDDFFKHYEKLFKGWENDVKEHCFDDEGFLVEFERENNVLYVRFWWLDNEEEDPSTCSGQDENKNKNEDE